MIVLDESIPPDEQAILKRWRISTRHIGYGAGRKGMKDESIIPFLLRLRRPTFFTFDFDFYRRGLCHARYCLVCLSVEQYEAAVFIHRFLRHKQFNTEAKRMSAVTRVSHAGLSVWRLHSGEEEHLAWEN